MSRIFFLFFISFAVYGSEIPDFNEISKSKDVIFFLSTTKSGSNWISSSLSAITRKPISWLSWKKRVFDSSSTCRDHPSYNRLGLPLISDKPLLYRTHYAFSELMQVPSHLNKLIFVTRNPKELIFRKFFLESRPSEAPDPQFIKEFLSNYLQAFAVYDAWSPENRTIVFYEDFISQGDEPLLKLLEFMGEKPVYLEDFIANKQEYMGRLLESYTQQHQHNSGGVSSLEGPKAIYYTKNANHETLTYIDEYLKKVAPLIWERYLERFQSPVEP